MKTYSIIILFCLVLVIATAVSMPAFAFTKSPEFIKATHQKEGKATRVGIAAGQFAPKEPRFTKYVPPRIIPSISVLTVGFRGLTANESPPIITPADEFRKQQEEKQEDKEKEKQEDKEKEKQKEKQEDKEKEKQKEKQEKYQEEKKEVPEEQEDETTKHEKTENENVRSALLSVNSAMVKDRRLSPGKGGILSLAIILAGLLAWGIIKAASIKAASRKQE